MRRWVGVFVLGFTMGIWADAALVEWVGDTTIGEFFVSGGIEFNEEVIDEALNPVVEDGDEEEGPGPNWLNEVTPAFRPA